MYTWRIGDRVLPLRRTRYHKVWVITAIRELPTSSAGVKLLEVRAEEQSSRREGRVRTFRSDAVQLA